MPGLLGTLAQLVFRHTHVSHTDLIEMFLAQVGVFRCIRCLGYVHVVRRVKNAEAKDGMSDRRSSAIPPLAQVQLFAFHVMVWSANNYFGSTGATYHHQPIYARIS